MYLWQCFWSRKSKTTSIRKIILPSLSKTERPTTLWPTSILALRIIHRIVTSEVRKYLQTRNMERSSHEHQKKMVSALQDAIPVVRPWSPSSNSSSPTRTCTTTLRPEQPGGPVLGTSVTWALHQHGQSLTHHPKHPLSWVTPFRHQKATSPRSWPLSPKHRRQLCSKGLKACVWYQGQERDGHSCGGPTGSEWQERLVRERLS